MRTVYFDTNVFDHLHKRIGVDDRHLEALSRATTDGSLSIRLSVHNIEETAALLTSQPDDAKAQFRLMKTLADLDYFFREPRDLVMASILAVAGGPAPTTPYVRDRAALCESLDLLATGGGAIDGLEWAVESTADQIRDFREAMNAGRENWREVLKQFPQGERQLPFEEYFVRTRRILAEGLYGRLAMPPIRPEETSALLELPYTRSYTDATASLLFAYSFEGRHAARGDSRDIMHAAVGGYAEVFVLNDRKFYRILERIPDRGYEIETLGSFAARMLDVVDGGGDLDEVAPPRTPG